MPSEKLQAVIDSIDFSLVKPGSPQSTFDYDRAFEKPISLFFKKNTDYGSCWTVLSRATLTDLIYIKAKRIKQIALAGEMMVEDSVEDEYIGIINYCIMANMMNDSEYPKEPVVNIGIQLLFDMYYTQKMEAYKIFLAKNHDYGEAWRDMRMSSFVDIILMKILRIKQIESNGGKVLVSEDATAGYIDCINYSVFALLKIEEVKTL